MFRLAHRRFGLEVIAFAGSRYAYRVCDRGHVLHASRACHRSVASAERAARRHVDDALRAWAWADAQLGYSSSK